MNIVQAHRSQVMVNGVIMPIELGGSALNWEENFIIPAFASNYYALNATLAMQSPQVLLNFIPIDAPSQSPMNVAFLNYFMSRSLDYSNDVTAIPGGMKFFDGFSGWSIPYVKAAGFSCSGDRTGALRFNGNFAVYTPAGQSDPAAITSPPDPTYQPVLGEPLSFAAYNFTKNGSPLDGVVNWAVSVSNNMTPDPSMVAGGGSGQPILPIDQNATGIQTATLTLTFQANQQYHLAQGDTIGINVQRPGGTNVTFTCRNLRAMQGLFGRNIGTGRQFRQYSATLLGVGNGANQGPLSVS